MSYLTKLRLNGVPYDIRDAAAYKAINILNGDSSVAGSVAHSIKTSLNNLKNATFRVVEELPIPETAEDGVIYLILEEGTKSGTYIEYIKVVGLDGKLAMEKIGTTDMDLANYETRIDASELAKRILEVNEFQITEDLVERDGYSYITLHTDDGTAEVGINRSNDSNIVYIRENIVYQSQLAALQNEVNEFKEKEQNDVDIINSRIDNEVTTLNQQTGLSSYITIEPESENTGIINIVDVAVLQPKSTRIVSDTSWYNADENTFALSTASEFMGLSELVKSGSDFTGKTIELTSDIDLMGQEFTPIGLVTTDNPNKAIYGVTDVGDKVFTGSFDGNGHTINNLRISQTVGTGWDNTGVGLFGVLGNGSTVKNINIKNVSIESPTANMVGIIAGYIPNTTTPYANTTTIENVHVTGNINIDGRIGVGAILGRAETGSQVVIKNCSVIGNDKSSSVIKASMRNMFAGCGAIAGCIYGKAENVVDNCTVMNVTVTSSNEANGGLVGHFERGTISNNIITNVDIFDTMDTSVYMQEAATVGAILGTVDSTIKANGNGGLINVKLENNALRNITIGISSSYTNSGNASGVELDENGYPNWISWPVVGAPRNIETSDPTPYVSSTNDWSELKSNINIVRI